MAARPTTPSAIVTTPRVTSTTSRPIVVITRPRTTITRTAPVVRPTVITPTTTLSTTSRVIVPTTTTTTSAIVSTTSSAIITTTSTTPLTPLPTTQSNTSSSTSLLASTSSTTTSSSTPLTTTSDTASQASSGVSTGAVVGGIIGGFVALGIIGAMMFLFLRKVREKREAQDRAFDATKFRQSAILLEEPTEKRRRPRPPTFLEQHVRNTPTPRADPYPPHPGPIYPQEHYGSPYAGPTTYTPAHAGNPYAAQGQYNQYQLSSNNVYSNRGYGSYPMSQGYSPPTQYPPQPHQPQYYPQQNPYGTPAPSVPRPNSSESDPNSTVLPNPFGHDSASISETVPSSQYVSTASVSRNASATQPKRSTGNDEAPPAYEITSTSSFANYKPDTKGNVTLTANLDDSTTMSTTRQNSTPAFTISTLSSTSSTNASTVVTQTQESYLATPANKNLSSRPMSSQTVYDPADAYGGM